MLKDKKIRTIRGQVYHILREEICSGKYEPGVRLQETELTKHLGVSRSPVREALLQLVADGLLIEVPNKGVFVREFTPKDIDEIFDMRLLLESFAIMNSSRHADTDRLQDLFDTLGMLEQTFAARDLNEYTKYDELLHNQLVELSDNGLLISTYEKVRSMNQQFRVFSLTSRKRFDESLVEHRGIIYALAKGDLEKAQRINANHLALARDCIKEQLRSSSRLRTTDETE